jgi:hypothetical protein
MPALSPREQAAEALRQALESLAGYDSTALFDIARNPSTTPQVVLRAAQVLQSRKDHYARHVEVVHAAEEARKRLLK